MSDYESAIRKDPTYAAAVKRWEQNRQTNG